MSGVDTNLDETIRAAPESSAVTLLLERVNGGDGSALNELIPLVYQELRRRAGAYMSAARAGHTLQPTALVHEAFAKLVASGSTRWQTSRHFFHAAAEVMRQVLVDHARATGARKRGGGMRRVGLEDADLPAADAETIEPDWEALDAALGELKKLDERRYRVVMLRYFAGLTDRQIAESLDVSEKTVRRDWATSKTFLKAKMDEARG